MSKIFFITGTGTGVGKTFVTTTLIKQLRASGKNIAAIKPIISGYNASDLASDTALILQSLALPITPENIEKISPWRFSAPLSPDMAAKKEGRKIELNEVVEFCQASAKSADILLIEGVGGVLVPLNETNTIRDLAEKLVVELDAEIILVAGSYLGSISHTLSAIEALAAKNLHLHKLIISESENSAATMYEIKQSLANFLPKNLPIICVSRDFGTEVALCFPEIQLGNSDYDAKSNI